jgi:UDPglucose 6-dehydrogenase
MSLAAVASSVEAAAREPIGVIGLWHLGSVTAACLAEAGNEVIGVDPDPNAIEELAQGTPPVAEPGLRELMARCSERLRFSTDPQALAAARQAWIAFDTPVDEEDHADVEWVMAQSARLLASLPEGALVVVSSQLPVGSVARLRERCAAERGDGGLRFACVPENLRLGRALDVFRTPDRIVAGVRDETDRRELAALLAPFSENVQWMRVESAEMTKHALNGFLATSIAFMNEIAGICESVGADAAEVARGLKSEQRIGPRAYLEPGDAFAGGTLARDIGFLRELAERHGLPAHVFSGVAEGNTAHKRWTRRKLLELFGAGAGGGAGAGADADVDTGAGAGADADVDTGADAGVDPDAAPPDGNALAGRTVAIWGLTYKPGTDTLRRSSAVELCHWLIEQGANVRAHDPVVSSLPASLADVELCASPLQALAGAEALVVCTAWPDYREVRAEEALQALAQPVVIDPAGWLRASLAGAPGARYLCVGTPPSEDGAALRSATEERAI